MDLSRYSVVETLRGQPIEIRALRAEDRAALLDAFGRMGEQSRYYRFFAPKQTFTEREIAHFLDVDFVKHVALIAVLEEAGQPVIVGGGRYIISRPGCAELAFGVDDTHQGWGIASALMRHLTAIARSAGLEEFSAEVLPANTPMLKVFERCGLPMTSVRKQGTVHVSLRLH